MNSRTNGRGWGKLASQAAETVNSASIQLRFRRRPPPIMMKSVASYTDKRVVTVGKQFAQNK